MRLRIRRQPDGTWLERELLRRAWTYQDLAEHAGISRMTLYFLLNPGVYGTRRKLRRGTLMPRTARAIAEALAGPDGNIADIMERYFEVDHDADTLSTR
jgi:AraC-like DNA-binding protein